MSISDWHAITRKDEKVATRESGIFTLIGTKVGRLKKDIDSLKEDVAGLEEDMDNWGFEKLKEQLDGITDRYAQIAELEELLREKMEDATKNHLALTTLAFSRNPNFKVASEKLTEIQKIIIEIQNIEENIYAFATEVNNKLSRFKIISTRYLKLVSSYLKVFDSYIENEEHILKRIRNELKKIRHEEEALEKTEKKMIEDGLIIDGLLEVQNKKFIAGQHDIEVETLETLKTTKNAMKHIAILKSKFDNDEVLSNMPKKLEQAYQKTLGINQLLVTIFETINELRMDILKIVEKKEKVTVEFYKKYTMRIHELEEQFREDIDELKTMRKDIARSEDGMHELQKHVSDIGVDHYREEYYQVLKAQYEKYQQLKGPEGQLAKIRDVLIKNMENSQQRDEIQKQFEKLNNHVFHEGTRLYTELGKVANSLQ